MFNIECKLIPRRFLLSNLLYLSVLKAITQLSLLRFQEHPFPRSGILQWINCWNPDPRYSYLYWTEMENSPQVS